MNKTLAAATVAALLGVAGAANAADLYAPGGLKDGPVYAAPETWTGFHVGLGVGGAAVNYDAAYSDQLFVTKTEKTESVARVASGNPKLINSNKAGLDGISGTGVFGTAEVGYDRQIGSFVAGVFFNYDFGDNVSTDAYINKYKASLDLNDSWTVGGRLGYLVNTSTLAYALAGYTEASFEAKAGKYKWDDTLSGWTVGGGLETRLSGNWYLKAEYRYTELDTESFKSHNSWDWGCFTFDKNRKLDVDTSVQTARLVLSYKADLFSGAYPTPLK